MCEIPPFQGLAPMISYAQNFEDVMLRRALPDVSQGFYVDLGAYHPVNDSVTKWFYDQGWSGINVEPVASLMNEFLVQRPRDTNLQLAVGAAHARGRVNIVQGSGLSSVSESSSNSPEVVDDTVEIIPLDDLLTTHAANKRVDFLKIDIEGSEAAVINGSRFSARPRVIVIEATAPNSQHGVWDQWEPHLLRSGYDFVWFDGLNRFYLAEEERWRTKFFTVPPNVFDNFKSIVHSVNLGGEQPEYWEARTKLAVEDGRRELRTQLSHVEDNRDTLLEQLKDASVRMREVEENRDGILLQLRVAAASVLSVESERDGLRSELEDALHEVEAAQESRDTLSAQLEYAAGQYQELEQSRTFALESLARGEKKRKALKRKIRMLEGRLERILNSPTWRLAAPLRAVAKLLKGTRS